MELLLISISVVLLMAVVYALFITLFVLVHRKCWGVVDRLLKRDTSGKPK